MMIHKKLLFSLAFCFNAYLNAQYPVINLKMPNLSDNQVIGCNAGLRPARVGGIRLEMTQLYNDDATSSKPLIHNYGHGGSGMSLSWGCAEEVLSMAEEATRSVTQPDDGQIFVKKTAAVIGAGVIGLTTAYVLLEAGWNVTIYADTLPPHTTSDVAVGIISQDFQVEMADEEMLARIKDAANRRLWSNVTTDEPTFKGFSTITKYNFSKSVIDQAAEKDKYYVSFGSNTVKLATTSPGIIVNVPVYLQDLLNKVQTIGAHFVQKHIDFLPTCLDMDESIIVNCTGLAAKNLTRDEHLYPIKGNMVYLAPQEDVNYSLLYNDPSLGDRFISLNARPGKDAKIIVGGSLEKNVWDATLDETICREILHSLRNFLGSEESTQS